jgi:hypothetical protein
MKVENELELTKHREYNDHEEMIREDTFVVSDEYLQTAFSNMFSKTYDDVNQFLDAYDPEIEGQELYKQAFEDDELILDDIMSIDKERLTVILYNTLEEMKEKQFDMDNDAFKSYLRKEIGVTEREWVVISDMLES